MDGSKHVLRTCGVRVGVWCPARRLVTGMCIAVIIVSLAGCGSSANSHGKAVLGGSAHALGTEPPASQRQVIAPVAFHQIVARLGRHAITLAYLEEWTPLEAVIASRYKLEASIPTGFVPDPPTYRNCIAYLAATATKSGVPASEGAVQLKSRCEHQHRMQVESTLSHLLHDTWSYEEAAKRGLKVSADELQRAIAKRGVKASLLRALGVPPSYQGYVVGAELLTEKLFATLPAYKRMRGAGHETMQMADEIDNESAAFYREMAQRWTVRTQCAPDYVVPGCGAYVAESSGL